MARTTILIRCMRTLTIDAIIKDTLGPLNRLTAELIKGIDEDDLIRRHKSEYIIPGYTVRRYLMKLQNGQCLRRDGKKVFLRDECNPVKLLGG